MPDRPFADPRPLFRARVIRAFDQADTTTLLGADGVVRRFSGDSAELCRAVLGFVVSPRTPAELLEHLSELAGHAVEGAGAVEETLALLEASGAVERGAPPGPSPPPRARIRLVLGLTGAIATAFAPLLVETLHARGFEVRIAATRNALRFVSKLALEALTHHPVVSSLWPQDPRAPVPHLELARWAEIMVVAPLSATSLSRLAQGSCEDVVSAAAVSTRAPVLLAPSMNGAMYTAPSARRNLEQLRDDGFWIAHPSCALEVADPPGARVPAIGAAPPVSAIADLVAAIVEHQVRVAPPGTAWEDIYRRQDPLALPWFTETIDPDFAALLDGVERGAGRLLDLGTGLGTTAIAAADRGFSVVATDVSARALELARERAGDRSILWVRDDLLETRLTGAFDVVVDRGLLHVLPRVRQAEYAAQLGRLVRPGGVLLLKCHAAGEREDLGTLRFSREDVEALFGDAFALERADAAVFPGPGGRAPKALLCALRRR